VLSHNIVQNIRGKIEVIQAGTVHTKPQEFRNLNLLLFPLLNFPKMKRTEVSQTTLMSDSELSTENLEILVLHYSQSAGFSLAGIGARKSCQSELCQDTTCISLEFQ
jgi:hypothetical protein